MIVQEIFSNHKGVMGMGETNVYRVFVGKPEGKTTGKDQGVGGWTI
jgi:hypothetical protein